MIKLNTEKLWDCYSHRQIIIVVTDRALYICGVLFFTHNLLKKLKMFLFRILLEVCKICHVHSNNNYESTSTLKKISLFITQINTTH